MFQIQSSCSCRVMFMLCIQLPEKDLNVIPRVIGSRQHAPAIWHLGFAYLKVIIHQQSCCGQAIPIDVASYGLVNLNNNDFFTYELLDFVWSLRGGKHCVSFDHAIHSVCEQYTCRLQCEAASRFANKSARLIPAALSYRALSNPEINDTFKCTCGIDNCVPVLDGTGCGLPLTKGRFHPLPNSLRKCPVAAEPKHRIFVPRNDFTRPILNAMHRYTHMYMHEY